MATGSAGSCSDSTLTRAPSADLEAPRAPGTVTIARTPHMSMNMASGFIRDPFCVRAALHHERARHDATSPRDPRGADRHVLRYQLDCTYPGEELQSVGHQRTLERRDARRQGGRSPSRAAPTRTNAIRSAAWPLPCPTRSRWRSPTGARARAMPGAAGGVGSPQVAPRARSCALPDRHRPPLRLGQPGTPRGCPRRALDEMRARGHPRPHGPTLAAQHCMTQDHHAPLVGRALIFARRGLRRARGKITRRQLTRLALLGFVLGFAFGPRLLALFR